MIKPANKKTHSKAWPQSTVDGPGWPNPAICTAESIKELLQLIESVASALRVSWKRIELPEAEAEADSSKPLDFISAAVSDQRKLSTSLRGAEQAVDVPLNPVREAPHQFPPEDPVLKSSAIALEKSNAPLFRCKYFYVGWLCRWWEF